jgi:hypothetical protein
VIARFLFHKEPAQFSRASRLREGLEIADYNAFDGDRLTIEGTDIVMGACIAPFF